MDIALISLLLTICIIQIVKDNFIIDTNELISEENYEIEYKDPKEVVKVKHYIYKVTYKNKRVTYKNHKIYKNI